MKVREGKAKVPILPRAVQIAFASATGVAFVALLVFVLVRPTTAEQTVAITDTNTSEGIVVSPEVQETANIDGGATEPAISTEEPEEVKPEVKPEPEAKVEVEEEPKKEEATADLTYVARSGDSYTVIARASVARIAAADKITLTPAQKVAAETYLTQDAGAVQLDVSERVTLSTESIKKAIEKAQSLTDDELAAWDVFADQVDFDTDDTPEPVAEDGGSSDTIDGSAVTGGSADAGATGGASGGGSGL